MLTPEDRSQPTKPSTTGRTTKSAFRDCHARPKGSRQTSPMRNHHSFLGQSVRGNPPGISRLLVLAELVHPRPSGKRWHSRKAQNSRFAVLLGQVLRTEPGIALGVLALHTSGPKSN